MKKLLGFLFVISVLAACNHAEESADEKVVEGAQQEVKQETQVESIAYEAYLQTNELDIYGYLTVAIIVKNNSNEEIQVKQEDFTLYDTQDPNAEFSLGETAFPTEITLAPQEENVIFGYYNVSFAKPDIFAINIEEVRLKYLGNQEVTEETVALQLNFPSQYEEQIMAMMYPEYEEIVGPESQPGLVISLYGPIDKEDGYIRVENTSSTEIYFDSNKIYLYDDVARYGTDPTMFDSEFDETMYVKPGEIIDYHERFIFDNYLLQDRSEIAENIKGVLYAPENGSEVYGFFNPEAERPEDFGEYYYE